MSEIPLTSRELEQVRKGIRHHEMELHEIWLTQGGKSEHPTEWVCTWGQSCRVCHPQAQGTCYLSVRPHPEYLYCESWENEQPCPAPA